jgi:hypothetical protein
MLNESKSSGKLNLGIIGPLANWSMKLQAYPEPNHGMIGYAIDEEENVELSYGGKKLILPKNTCEVKKSPQFASIEIKPYTKWFSNEANREILENFVEDYLNDRILKPKDEDESVISDIELVLDTIGIPGNVTNFTKISDNFYEANLSNGIEVELKKHHKNDIFKALKIYKDKNSKFPDIKLKRNGLGKQVEFRSRKGVFSETADTLSSLFKIPTTKYLVGVCLSSIDKQKEEELIEHLKKLAKYHSKDLSSPQKYEMEKNEIERIKDILSNTMDTIHLEEMVRGISPEK